MYQISQYRVEDTPIGEGGMGRILLGYTPEGERVAIKEILPEFAADLEQRFRISQEMRFLKRLQHKAIVKIQDSFMYNDRFYIVMELVNGLNLEQYVQQHGTFDGPTAKDFMIKILDVLQYVHNQDVIHRDMKPSNIMVRDNGDICLLDFGIAKDLHSQHTQFGTIIGSDGYMSPEQATAGTIDARSDIYSMGCVFYFMLTGQHAFPPQASQAELLLAVTEGKFPKLTSKNTRLDKETLLLYEKIIEQATDRNMLQRFATCTAFIQAFTPHKPTGSGTVQSHRNDGRCFITLGREGCDICFNDPNYKVSRHHAEIEWRNFTGGSYYIFRDDSSNGTVIGQSLVHHMSYHIASSGPLPNIYLAGDPQQQVDWDTVKSLLRQREAEILSKIQEPTPSEEVSGKTIDRDYDSSQLHPFLDLPAFPADPNDIKMLAGRNNHTGLLAGGILLFIVGIIVMATAIILLLNGSFNLIATVLLSGLAGCLAGVGLMLTIKNIQR